MGIQAIQRSIFLNRRSLPRNWSRRSRSAPRMSINGLELFSRWFFQSLMRYTGVRLYLYQLENVKIKSFIESL